MPTVQLITATFKDHDALHSMAQFYQYDFTEFLPGEIDEDGTYPYINVRYYLAKGRQAYVARVDERLAGFVLVEETAPHRGGPGHYVAEFFVMRRYRGQGIGRTLAFQTFDTYRGWWEIAEVGPNVPAQQFWRKVIDEYTKGRYQEEVTLEEGLSIVWQSFDSGAW